MKKLPEVCQFPGPAEAGGVEGAEGEGGQTPVPHQNFVYRETRVRPLGPDRQTPPAEDHVSVT